MSLKKKLQVDFDITPKSFLPKYSLSLKWSVIQAKLMQLIEFIDHNQCL